MISIYSTAVKNELRTLTEIEPGSWLRLVMPTESELRLVAEKTGAPEDFLRAALDDDESPRIETEEEYTLIIADTPIVKPEGTSYIYSTIPLGIILSDDYFITVSTEQTTLLSDFSEKRVRGGFDTCKRTRFLLQILYRNAGKYLSYLRQIDKQNAQIQAILVKSMKNRELLQMLNLEKSLVYFSTSLKGNEIVLEKLLRGNMVRRYPDDTDLLEDVIIDNKQAIEMCAIHRDITASTMDTFASIISNNLNIVMKLQAAISILIAIPSVIAGFWGMNVPVPFEHIPSAFYIIIGVSVLATGLMALFMRHRKMF
ncbi:MAG: magnesium transporter CorA family protein [Clostridiales bacterium]|nr:magnesium transporter CorA family protein [Clostridiales bacterium]MBP3941319.1 magnesium transporter CorA family protein [Christensenellaceae bacterium]MBR3841665.1 magnesium transporter CorA family protein [Christensenellaceae bacterium]